jgi:hypothetical protein
MFDEEFIKNLPSDKWEGLLAICNRIAEHYKKADQSKWMIYHTDYIMAFALLETFAKSHGIPFYSAEPKGISISNIHNTYSSSQSLRDTAEREIVKRNTENVLENARTQYGSMLNLRFTYVFSDGDLNRIQTLINELRDLIKGSKEFEENHRERILKKLEKLQAELHKRMSNLDTFWGLIGDAGVVLGKFGEDAKPFVDRIREIAEIVWKTQARAEELPSGFSIPLLPETKRDSKNEDKN